MTLIEQKRLQLLHSLYGIRAVANFGNGTTVDTFNFFLID